MQPKGGKRDDLGGMYFRSIWEANVARFLNWLQSIGEIERWEYEPDEFEFPVKRGNRFYKPDFKVFYQGGHFEYWEVKGYMDKDSKTKLDRMARYYPDIKVIVLDNAWYSDFRKTMRNILPGFEIGD